MSDRKLLSILRNSVLIITPFAVMSAPTLTLYLMLQSLGDAFRNLAMSAMASYICLAASVVTACLLATKVTRSNWRSMILLYPAVICTLAYLSLYLVEGAADLQALSEFSNLASELARAFPVVIRSSFFALIGVGLFLGYLNIAYNEEFKRGQ